MPYSAYLTFDSSFPMITSSCLKHELLLYNLSQAKTDELLGLFNSISGKELNLQSLTSELSGGQQVLLMALIALLCPAPKLRFINLMTSLDHSKRIVLQELISKSTKDILLETHAC
jgi:ABC-type microcin C transport system duplicated ATPase subunit YejF